MIILIETQHVRCEKSSGYNGHPSEWVKLRWDGPRSNIYWVVDRQGLLLRGFGGKFLISNRYIEHFAAVSHHAWCTLLIFGSVRLGGPPWVMNLTAPEKMQTAAYSELGTTFIPMAAKTMIQGIKNLEHKIIEFTWREFLEHTHLCRATELEKSATLLVEERALSSAVR